MDDGSLDFGARSKLQIQNPDCWPNWRFSNPWSSPNCSKLASRPPVCLPASGGWYSSARCQSAFNARQCMCVFCLWVCVCVLTCWILPAMYSYPVCQPTNQPAADVLSVYGVSVHDSTWNCQCTQAIMTSGVAKALGWQSRSHSTAVRGSIYSILHIACMFVGLQLHIGSVCMCAFVSVHVWRFTFFFSLFHQLSTDDRWCGWVNRLHFLLSLTISNAFAILMFCFF